MGYRLFDPLTEKMIIRRDVIFDEHGEWDWSVESNSLFEFF